MNMTINMRELNSSTRLATAPQVSRHEDPILELIETHRSAALAFEKSPTDNEDLTAVTRSEAALLRKKPKTNAGWAALIRYAQSAASMSIDDGNVKWWSKMVQMLGDHLDRAPDKATTTSSDAKCPVAALAMEAEELLKANRVLDNRRSKQLAGDDRLTTAILDRLDAIKETVSFLRPRSAVGAAFQIILADGETDVLFTSTFHSEFAKEQRERLASRLHYAARSYFDSLGTTASLTEVRNYFMADYLDPCIILKRATQGKTLIE